MHIHIKEFKVLYSPLFQNNDSLKLMKVKIFNKSLLKYIVIM